MTVSVVQADVYPLNPHGGSGDARRINPLALKPLVATIFI